MNDIAFYLLPPRPPPIKHKPKFYPNSFPRGPGKRRKTRTNSQIVVSYGIGTIVSGACSPFASTTLEPLGITGCLFKKTVVPFAFASCFLTAFCFTRLMNSSRDRERETCSTRTLTLFSMKR